MVHPHIDRPPKVGFHDLSVLSDDRP